MVGTACLEATKAERLSYFVYTASNRFLFVLYRTSMYSVSVPVDSLVDFMYLLIIVVLLELSSFCSQCMS